MKHIWSEEFDDLIRGAAGGLIFGIPLLYTMEVWQRGKTFSSLSLIVLLMFILTLNIFFSFVSGLRHKNKDEFTVITAVSDGLSALGLSILVSILVLLVIHRIDLTLDGIADHIGIILSEAALVSIGVCFSNSQFDPNKDRSDDSDKKVKDKNKNPEELTKEQKKLDFKNIGATVIGATVLSFSIAPTEEVSAIAIELNSQSLLLLLIFELLIAYVILFASGFQEHKVYVKSWLQKPISESLMCITISLGVSYLLLSLLGFQADKSSAYVALANTIALGLPAVVGGAAGRLII